MAKTYRLPDGTVLDYQTALKLYNTMEREFAVYEMSELGEQNYFPENSWDVWNEMASKYIEQKETNPEMRKIEAEIATSVLKETLVKQVQTPSGMLKFLDRLKETDAISFIRTVGGVPETLVLDNDFSLMSGKSFTVADFRPMVQALLEQGADRLTYSGNVITGLAVADNLILFTVKK